MPTAEIAQYIPAEYTNMGTLGPGGPLTTTGILIASCPRAELDLGIPLFDPILVLTWIYVQPPPHWNLEGVAHGAPTGALTTDHLLASIYEAWQLSDQAHAQASWTQLWNATGPGLIRASVASHEQALDATALAHGDPTATRGSGIRLHIANQTGIVNHTVDLGLWPATATSATMIAAYTKGSPYATLPGSAGAGSLQTWPDEALALRTTYHSFV